MKKYFAHLAYLIITLTFMVGVATPVFAEDITYTVLAPIPGTTVDPDCTVNCKTDFKTYLPGLFNFSIGLAAALAFVMITFGGFTYMTTDAIGKKEEGKKYVENAVYGLLLVIGAYAILYTINPKILQFDLNVQKPELQKYDPGVIASNFGAFTPAITPGVTPGSCPNCKSLEALGVPANAKLDPTTVGLDSDFGNKIREMNANLKNANVLWAVTEAWPPTINHEDSCHKSGTCIDAGVSNQASDIKTFINAAKNAGLNANYEVTNDADRQAYIQAGVPAANISVNTRATGKHFHVKN